MTTPTIQLDESGNEGGREVKREAFMNGVIASKTCAIAWMPCHQCSQLLIVPMSAYIRGSPVLCEECWGKDDGDSWMTKRLESCESE